MTNDLVYEDAQGLRMVLSDVWVDGPPKEITVGGVVYALVGKAAGSSREMKPLTEEEALAHYRSITLSAPARPAMRDGRFKSYQLPRFDPHHKGEFSPQGHPLFTSRRQAEETAARTQGETGVETRYGEL